MSSTSFRLARCIIAFGLLAATWLSSVGILNAAPRVATSVAPIHSLAVAVMEGVAEPQLILKGSASAHHFTLKPSDARHLQQAELVFWVGPNMEASLQAPIRSLVDASRLVTLSNNPDLLLLPVRQNILLQHAGQEDHDHHGENDKTDSFVPHDPHLWLDPDNALALVDNIEQELSKLDPQNAEIYAVNAGNLRVRIASLTLELESNFKDTELKPYLVLHDAFQYFERRFNVGGGAAIRPGDDRRPGAARVSKINQLIKSGTIGCIFGEPRVYSKILDSLGVDGDEAAGELQKAVLDPIGSTLKPGADLYFQLMRDLADGLLGCAEEV